MNVKWLRRIELGTAPWMTRWETSKYTDPLPNGTAHDLQLRNRRQVDHHVAGASATAVGERGWRPITGLAWSGRGRITRVEVSTDGGAIVARRRAAGPGAAQVPRALPVHVGVERQGGGAAEPRHRRGRLRAADAHGAGRGARAWARTTTSTTIVGWKVESRRTRASSTGRPDHAPIDACCGLMALAIAVRRRTHRGAQPRRRRGGAGTFAAYDAGSVPGGPGASRGTASAARRTRPAGAA